MPPGDRHRILLLLDIGLAAVLALTAVASFAGGLDLNLGLIRVSIRNLTRPLLIAAALAAIRLWLARPLLATPAHSAPPHPAPVIAPLRIALLTLTFTAMGCWVAFLTTVCGGSDSYGYVSASRLLLAGTLVQPQEIAAWLPVPNALDVATPAGYVPAGDRSGIVPQYPLGLPALMALLTLAFGSTGPYLAAPLTGLALVILTNRVAEAWVGSAAGLLAAALVAWNPLVMAYAAQPMSDVPAAMWYMAAVWCLVRSPRAPLWAGIFAGLSFVTRPGGIGAIAALGFMAMAAPADRARSLAHFALGLAPLVAVQAGLQWFLFGSALSTGYGPLATLYAGRSALENLGIYARGFLTVHTPWWFAALAAAALRPRREPLWWGVAALALGGAPYVFYFRFDHWETLRFLLPGVVLLSIAAASGIERAAAVRGARALAAVIIVAGCAAAFAVRSAAFLQREGVFRLMDRESRYPDTAERVARLTPPSSIVFAAQHSGSLRHYADRVTLRWDLLRPEDLTPVLTALAGRNLPAFVVLEGEEQARFRDRFAGSLEAGSMLPVAQVREVQIWELRR